MAVRLKDRGQLMYSSDVMKMLRISERTLYRWHQLGMPRHRKTGIKFTIYYENEVQDWFDKL